MEDFNEIQQFFNKPKSTILEYSSLLPTSKNLAVIISSLANTQGGIYLIGLSDKGLPIGLSPDFKTDSIAEKALSLLGLIPKISKHYFKYDNKNIIVFKVDKSEIDILLDDKKYIRHGSIIKVANAANVKFYDGDKISITNDKDMEKHEDFEFNAYDINLTESYSELRKQVENIKLSKTGITIEEYLFRMKEGIDSYSKYHSLGSLESTAPIILKYPAYNFHAHLAFQVMTFDANKIHAMLDYQHEHYLGIDKFQDIVQHGVYDWIKQNTPIENNERLKIVMDWVEKRKDIVTKNNKLAISIGDKILKKFKDTNSSVGEVMMMAVLNNIFTSLSPPEKQIFNEVYDGMFLEEYVTYDEGQINFIRLGRRGYSRIYENVEDATIVTDNRESDNLPLVVILTAIEEEYNAVRLHLEDITEFKKGVRYEQGVFKFNNQKIATVIIKECGQKNANSAQETQRALSNFTPDCMLFVGVAGSRKPNDYGIGDVIFPTNVHYYEGGKSLLDDFQARPDDVKPTFELSDLAMFERRKQDWKKLIKGTLHNEVSANVGILACGEQIVEHYNSDTGKLITKHYGDAACVAMEEYGFLNTLMRQGVDYASVKAGVVRGISDIIERDETESATANATDPDRRPDWAKIFASNTASAFAFWLIVKLYSKTVN